MLDDLLDLPQCGLAYYVGDISVTIRSFHIYFLGLETLQLGD